MNTHFVTIALDDLQHVTGGKHLAGDGSQPEPRPEASPISGEYCKDGMAFGFSGTGKFKTPVGVEVEGNVTFVQCK